MSRDQALAELLKNRCKQFDPSALDAFLEVAEKLSADEDKSK
jgi:HD-GYP domain-containing protein (c-di-GMP phosphodiesterase class II)